MIAKVKASVLRIIGDIIKADQVIDQHELDCYNTIVKRLMISHDDEILSTQISLSEAVTVVKELSKAEREKLMCAFREMSLTDGFCSKEEAMILLAMEYCLIKNPRTSSVLSAEIDPKLLTNNQVLYVESSFDEATNFIIEKNIRLITKEFKSCGFDFVYIPEVVQHYKDATDATISNAVKILNPSLSDKMVNIMVEKLRKITTPVFCIEQLHHKLKMVEMFSMPPSILLYIGISKVNESFITNYLQIGLQNNILEEVYDLCDSILSLSNTDNINISLRCDNSSKFRYNGFYREIFDLVSLKRSVSSNIAFDFDEGILVFNDIDEKIMGLHRKEKALYTLFVYEIKNGGISFMQPTTRKEQNDYNIYMQNIQNRYAYIYNYFGGNSECAPDITNSEIRRPMISRIKNALNKFSSKVFEVERFAIAKGLDGKYKIHSNIECFKYYSHFHNSNRSIEESELFQRLDRI